MDTSLPETPGLGIDLDVEALKANPYLEAPARRLPQVSDEGP